MFSIIMKVLKGELKFMAKQNFQVISHRVNSVFGPCNILFFNSSLIFKILQLLDLGIWLSLNTDVALLMKCGFLSII